MSGKTEREIELEVKLQIANENLEWLLDYARRVAQRQVVSRDVEQLTRIRIFLTICKPEVEND
jgi:hypothetical protein